MTGALDATITLARSDRFGLDIVLSAEPGETHCVLGPNGAGKSTMVEALVGLLPIDAGIIQVAGQVYDDPVRSVFLEPQDRSVGVVFQDALLFPHLTVRGNLAFGPRSVGLTRSAVEDLVDRVVTDFALESIEARKPGELSGGEVRRVAIARALITDPDMLILDEPFASLDIVARPALRQTVAEALDAFAGVAVVITHDPAEALHLGDVIHIFENGRIVQTGTPEDIRLKPASPYAARVAGVNLLSGVARGGSVDVDGHRLTIADSGIEGDVLVSFHPHTVALHESRPHGSARNVWRTTVRSVESHGGTARVQLGAPLRMTAEVTAESLESLGVTEGSEFYVSIKATELSVQRSGNA